MKRALIAVTLAMASFAALGFAPQVDKKEACVTVESVTSVMDEAIPAKVYAEPPKEVSFGEEVPAAPVGVAKASKGFARVDDRPPGTKDFRG